MYPSLSAHPLRSLLQQWHRLHLLRPTATAEGKSEGDVWTLAAKPCRSIVVVIAICGYHCMPCASVLPHRAQVLLCLHMHRPHTPLQAHKVPLLYCCQPHSILLLYCYPFFSPCHDGWIGIAATAPHCTHCFAMARSSLQRRTAYQHSQL